MKLKAFEIALLSIVLAFTLLATLVLLRWSKLSVGATSPVRMDEIYTGWRA